MRQCLTKTDNLGKIFTCPGITTKDARSRAKRSPVTSILIGRKKTGCRFMEAVNLKHDDLYQFGNMKDALEKYTNLRKAKKIAQQIK
jgi:hypothetical protein